MAEVRLAELVAALSLGVDLGFGQPMEHVLRECMIALRLAERSGLEEAERSTVYYTALLVNVGCHADAHEQAKWFGDDIALRSGKYERDLRSVRAAAATMSLVGSGNPPLHRFRVGLEFAISGRRDFDGMIARHAAVARGLAERLGLSAEVQESVGSSYEQWDGKGWPGGLAGDRIPVAARLSQFAEFVEVAHRLGGTGAALELAERRDLLRSHQGRRERGEPYGRRVHLGRRVKCAGLHREDSLDLCGGLYAHGQGAVDLPAWLCDQPVGHFLLNQKHNHGSLRGRQGLLNQR